MNKEEINYEIYFNLFILYFVNLCIHYELYVPVSHNISGRNQYIHKLIGIITLTLLFSKND